MKVDVNVDIQMEEAYKYFSESNLALAQFALANQALADMNQYVPRREGDLQTSGHVASNKEQLIWDTPYASSQYRGGNTKATFRHYTTPGTGPYWDKVARANHMSDWKQAWVKGAGF